MAWAGKARRGLGMGLGVALTLGTALTPAEALDFSWAQAIDPDVVVDPFTLFMIKAYVPAVVSGDGSVAGYLRLVPGAETYNVESYLWDGGTPTLFNDPLNPTAVVGVYGFSFDGNTVVGTHGSRGFRWTEANGFDLLDQFTAEPVEMEAINSFSDSAAVIVGHAFDAGGEIGFPTPVFWDSTGAIHRLLSASDPFFNNGKATLVSGDGTIVYGRLADVVSGADDPLTSTLVRWNDINASTPGQLILSTEDATTALGETVRAVIANDTSYDGSVLVGNADISDAVTKAFVWTADSGGFSGAFRNLSLPDGFSSSTADLVSKLGDVAVGSARNGSEIHVVRWDLDDGGATLDISKTSKTAGSSHAADSTDEVFDIVTGMSEDASIIVGTTMTTPENPTNSITGNSAAFRWSEEDGWQTIFDFLNGRSVDVDGWTFDSTGTILSALGAATPMSGRNISADGKVIVGRGTRHIGEGVWEDIFWLTRCMDEDENCGVTTVDDIYEGVVSVGSMAEVSNLYFDDLFSTLSDTSKQAGPNGSMFGWGAGDSDPMSSAGLGINLRLGSTVTGGLAVSRAHIVTPLAFDGEAAFDATAVSAYLAGRPDSGLVWEAGLSSASLAGTVERGYLNGNAVEYSSGETEGSALGASAQAGWRFADDASQTAITPYVGYTFARSSYEGWAETGGSFPAVFSDFSTLTHIVRVGADVEHDFAGGVVGTAGLALVHRSTDSGTMTFDLPGIIDGGVTAETGPAMWAEVNLGLAVPLAQSATGIFGLTGRIPQDGEPSVAGHAALSFAF